MPQIIVAQRMWQRRDTAAAWTAVNPILNFGEWGIEQAPAGQVQKAKLGDGVTPWNSLPYYGGTGGGIVEIVPGDNVTVDSSDPARPVVSAVFPPPPSGGVLPMVNGEIINNQPVFMYKDDGELIYSEI